MTHALHIPHSHPRLGERLSQTVAGLGTKRARRAERVRTRRTTLAMSEEARIHAQMRYRRMRYRHMAN